VATFNDFWKELTSQLGTFASKNWQSYKKDAESDATAFATSMKDDLQTWTSELAQGTLTSDDFKFLVQGKKDLAALVALKQAGLAEAALDQFVNGVLNVIVSAATKVFL
jgi:hypothetical protein